MVVNHDDAEKICFTCANAFVKESGCRGTCLCCVIQEGMPVDDDDTCDEWN